MANAAAANTAGAGAAAGVVTAGGLDRKDEEGVRTMPEAAAVDPQLEALLPDDVAELKEMVSSG